MKREVLLPSRIYTAVLWFVEYVIKGRKGGTRRAGDNEVGEIGTR